MKIQRESGFSFIELMVTLLIITALAGMGMALYSQYQTRAYNGTALQQGLQLRTAFEAGLASQSSLGSTVMLSTFTMTFEIDGDLGCTGCGDAVPVIPGNGESLIPGFEHQAGVFLDMSVLNQSYAIFAGHCMAMIDDGAQYDGWSISDVLASTRVAFASSGGEEAACASVRAGGDFS